MDLLGSPALLFSELVTSVVDVLGLPLRALSRSAGADAAAASSATLAAQVAAAGPAVALAVARSTMHAVHGVVQAGNRSAAALNQCVLFSPDLTVVLT